MQIKANRVFVYGGTENLIDNFCKIETVEKVLCVVPHDAKAPVGASTRNLKVIVVLESSKADLVKLVRDMEVNIAVFQTNNFWIPHLLGREGIKLYTPLMAARSPGSFEELAVEFVQGIKIRAKVASKVQEAFPDNIISPIGLTVEQPPRFHFKGFDSISDETRALLQPLGDDDDESSSSSLYEDRMVQVSRFSL